MVAVKSIPSQYFKNLLSEKFRPLHSVSEDLWCVCLSPLSWLLVFSSIVTVMGARLPPLGASLALRLWPPYRLKLVFVVGAGDWLTMGWVTDYGLGHSMWPGLPYNVAAKCERRAS